MLSWQVRPAEPADAVVVAAVWLAARHANTATIPAPVHGDDDVRRWVREDVLPNREVWVAVDAGDEAIGVLVLDRAWLDQLYVVPDWTGRGVGSALLDLAKHRRPDGFDLWTFVSNTAAQRFYERHGLVEAERTDGSDNEERAPDIRYSWQPGSAPEHSGAPPPSTD